MVSSNSLELKLSLKPSYVPKTIANLLKDVSSIDNPLDKLVVLNDYINHLEEELNSIDAFKHQLPQCMLLIMEALGTLKVEFMNIKNGMGISESEGPLMEFLANKRKQYEEKRGDISVDDNQKYDFKGKGLMSSSSSHQLLNPKQHKAFGDFIQASNQNPIIFNRNNGRFSSVNGTTNNNGEGGLNLTARPNWRNNRRSWTPQLHAKFVEVLHRLGGIEAATPKQIREMMQIEGLTNDQVKSHLQKYRLHCRRVPASNVQGLGSFEDPWHPPIYYGDPLSRKTPMKNNSNPGGSRPAAANFGRKSYSAFN